MLSRLNHHKAFVWYLFFIVAIIEFFIFREHVLRNLINYYPGFFDQSDYLLMSYRIYEHIKAEGLINGLIHSDMLHNGILFLIQAVGLFFLLGANRLSALLPNLFYFLLLQASVIFVIRSLTKKNYFPFIFLGLILSIRTPFMHAGSIFDFRMDFIAFCLYGVFASSVIKAQIFIDRKWSIIAGLIACLMILLRCITVVYIVFLMGSLFCYFTYGLLRNKQHFANRSRANAQLKNVVIASLIIAIAVFPYLWLNKEAIYHYYVSTHVISNEKYVRAREVGITNQLAFFTFYPLSLFSDHLGDKVTRGMLLLLSISLFFYAIWRRFYCRALNTATLTLSTPWKDGFVFLILCTLIPLLVLTMDTSKSPVVGSIAAIPCLWLVFWTCLYLDQYIIETKAIRLIFNLLAVYVFLYSVSHQIEMYRHHNSRLKQQQLNVITKMYQDIGDYAENNHWSYLHISVDQISDYLIPSAISDVYYETRHKLIRADLQGLGSTMFPISQEDALRSLQSSNVIILNLDKYPFSVYPFNQTIGSLKPIMLNYADQHFMRLGEYAFLNSIYRVYVATDKKV